MAQNCLGQCGCAKTFVARRLHKSLTHEAVKGVASLESRWR